MSRRVNFRPQAEAEAHEARDWYEARHAGLGHEFAKDVDRAIGMIGREEHVSTELREGTRRGPML